MNTKWSAHIVSPTFKDILLSHKGTSNLFSLLLYLTSSGDIGMNFNKYYLLIVRFFPSSGMISHLFPGFLVLLHFFWWDA
jgi:hypothetical protein